MPTDAQLMAELRRRGVSGQQNDEDEALRQELKRRGMSAQTAPEPVRATPEPTEVKASVPEALARGAASGATLGFVDELLNLNPFAPGAGSRFKQRSEEVRQERPVASLVGEMAGGLVTGGAGAARAGIGRTLAGTVGRQGGAGAALGGAAGAGYGEGNRVPETLAGAAIGGGAGAAIPAAAGAVRKVVPEILGLTTGAGPESIKVAVQAGKEGGETGKLFVDSMRGKIPMENVVGEAKDALRTLHRQNMEAYRTGKGALFAETAEKPIDFNAIRDQADKVFTQRTFKGVNIDPKAGTAKQELQGVLDQWQQLDPAEFHTVEGLDAMRMQVGSILDATEFGTPARRIANETYHAISKAIEDQAPGYKEVLRGYAQMKGHLDDLQRATLGGNKAAAETSLRKLQLAMRDSVATAAGSRTKAVQELSAAGGDRIVPQLAGATMSSLAPRGLVSRLGAGSLALGGGFAGNPGALAGVLATSPRLVGEAALKTGQLARGLNRVPRRGVPAGSGTLASVLANR